MCEKHHLPIMLNYIDKTRDNALRLAAEERWEKMATAAARRRRRNHDERWGTK